jgi:hypothetical protein
MSTPWWFFLIAAGLIVMSGFFSGLNLGLMSLAPDELKVVMEGSADEQAKIDATTPRRSASSRPRTSSRNSFRTRSSATTTSTSTTPRPRRGGRASSGLTRSATTRWRCSGSSRAKTPPSASTRRPRRRWRRGLLWNRACRRSRSRTWGA